jgi:hypothetical protein
MRLAKCLSCGEYSLLTTWTIAVDGTIYRARKCKKCGKAFYFAEQQISSQLFGTIRSAYTNKKPIVKEVIE